MTEPISALGAVALTEGIKFLYTQAGEILKRWRERQDAAKQAATQPNQTEPVQVNLPPSVFEGQMSAPIIHFDKVEPLAEPLKNLRRDLSDYADGIETVDVTDENLLQTIDAFRKVLEAVYQQRLTFKGEPQPSSGSPMVESEISDVKQIAGYVAGVRAKNVKAGTLRGKIGQVEDVKQGGTVAGVDVGDIG